jgi:hypothetical protein
VPGGCLILLSGRLTTPVPRLELPGRLGRSPARRLDLPVERVGRAVAAGRLGPGILKTWLWSGTPAAKLRHRSARQAGDWLARDRAGWAGGEGAWLARDRAGWAGGEGAWLA